MRLGCDLGDLDNNDTHDVFHVLFMFGFCFAAWSLGEAQVRAWDWGRRSACLCGWNNSVYSFHFTSLHIQRPPRPNVTPQPQRRETRLVHASKRRCMHACMHARVATQHAKCGKDWDCHTLHLLLLRAMPSSKPSQAKPRLGAQAQLRTFRALSNQLSPCPWTHARPRGAPHPPGAQPGRTHAGQPTALGAGSCASGPSQWRA